MNRKIVRRYIITIAAFIVCCALVIVLMNLGEKEYETVIPVIKIEKPKKRTISESITLSGYVEAESMIPVVPFVNGTVIEYYAKEGKSVKKGETLLIIDDSLYQQQKLQAEAAYYGYQSSFERVERLYKNGAATQQEYDTLKSQRDAAKAQFDLAKLQLGYTKVTASINGTILQAPLSKGAIATTTQPAAVIADLDKLVVRLSVPEKYFTLFVENKDLLIASVTRPGNEGLSEDMTTEARVDVIAPYVDALSKSFTIILYLEGDFSLFRPGMYIKAKISYRTKENVPSFPFSVRKIDGSCYIYDEASSSVKWVDFTPEIKDSDFFAVPEEYANTYFVVDGQGSVFDGQLVRVLDSTGVAE
ncbi:MAG: efflux RND transporter periplasmic adaptor subunit [Treponemataceae bacterium]|nr:efflux RND transporter periplasmic adaptor subunit [Treponemataceae bacterium]